jgi:CDP-glucose 4,6-dehydratase
MFESTYSGKNVLVTGHTGFKGSWLCLWLEQMRANVSGYSLHPPTEPNHYNLLELSVNSTIGDIRNYDKFFEKIKSEQPEVIFHLAAQSSVLYSYDHPVETFSTNIIGTMNVLEACRHVDSVRAVVIVTTDKCYQVRNVPLGYVEDDPLGGYDPYSSSKACAELITTSYRNLISKSIVEWSHKSLLICTARGGNVIGGGDWTRNRLIPDLMHCAATGNEAVIRNPDHIRPWQHVLDLLAGYLLLGQSLLQGNSEYVGAWNFGSDYKDQINVLSVAKILKSIWGAVEYKTDAKSNPSLETPTLNLNSNKALNELGWERIWSGNKMFKKTVDWYKMYYVYKKVLSISQIQEYAQEAKQKYLV